MCSSDLVPFQKGRGILEAMEGVPRKGHDSSGDRGGDLRAQKGNHLARMIRITSRHSPFGQALEVLVARRIRKDPGQARMRVGDAALVEDVNEAAVEEAILDFCSRAILHEELLRIEGGVARVATDHAQHVACGGT